MAIITVQVKPNSSQQKILIEPDGSLKVYLKSAAIEGKANAELIKLLSKQFKVPQSQIMIKSGVSAKLKLVEISGLKQLPE